MSLKSVENHDEKGSHANAAGKSVLVRSIANTVYNSLPTNANVKTATRKSAYYRKKASSRSRLNYSIDGVPTEITRYNAGTSLKTRIIQADAEIECHTATAAQGWIDEHFPVSEDFFYATCHLDSNRPFPLLSGKRSAKFNFICELFNFNNYDVLQEYFKQQRTELGSEQKLQADRKERLQQLQQEIVDIQEQVGNRTLADIDAEINHNQQLLQKFKDAQRALELVTKITQLQGGQTLPQANYKELVAALQEINNQLAAWETASQNYTNYVNFYHQHEQALIRLQGQTSTYLGQELAGVRQQKSAKEGEYNLINKQLTDLEGLDQVCPLCHQDINEHALYKTKQRLTGDLTKVSEQVEDFGVQLEELTADLALVKNWEQVYCEAPDQTVNAQLLANKADVSQTIQLFDREQEYDHLQRLINDLPDELRDNAAQLVESMQTVDFGNIDNQLRHLKHLRLNLDKLREQESILVTQVNEADGLIRHIRMLEGLISACGNKGLKSLACRDIMDDLIDRINENAAYIFPSTTSFHYELSGSELELTYGGNRSEVVGLSGAEGRFFTVLVLTSILSLLESSKRMNILVLDEMDANMDDLPRQRFYAELVPLIAETIPHVICVTPQPYREPGFDEFRVIKENDRAIVVKV